MKPFLSHVAAMKPLIPAVWRQKEGPYSKIQVSQGCIVRGCSSQPKRYNVLSYLIRSEKKGGTLGTLSVSSPELIRTLGKHTPSISGAPPPLQAALGATQTVIP